eukprot:TRINITY_DN4515_c0_g1_i2.p1 TRINITY_DN4515_c0_g1~~TRINITY_DN4515_c0_g1_i2.p1  ORF type:complete len:541 (+),score=210.80 TRINITY_DN4515_c0_g1_i2:48-1625(+)
MVCDLCTPSCAGAPEDGGYLLPGECGLLSPLAAADGRLSSESSGSFSITSAFADAVVTELRLQDAGGDGESPELSSGADAHARTEEQTGDAGSPIRQQLLQEPPGDALSPALSLAEVRAEEQTGDAESAIRQQLQEPPGDARSAVRQSLELSPDACADTERSGDAEGSSGGAERSSSGAECTEEQTDCGDAESATRRESRSSSVGCTEEGDAEPATRRESCGDAESAIRHPEQQTDCGDAEPAIRKEWRSDAEPAIRLPQSSVGCAEHCDAEPAIGHLEQQTDCDAEPAIRKESRPHSSLTEEPADRCTEEQSESAVRQESEPHSGLGCGDVRLPRSSLLCAEEQADCGGESAVRQPHSGVVCAEDQTGCGDAAAAPSSSVERSPSRHRSTDGYVLVLGMRMPVVEGGYVLVVPESASDGDSISAEAATDSDPDTEACSLRSLSPSSPPPTLASAAADAQVARFTPLLESAALRVVMQLLTASASPAAGLPRQRVALPVCLRLPRDVLARAFLPPTRECDEGAAV